MNDRRHSLVPRRARARRASGWLRTTASATAVTAAVLAVLALPASAGTTRISSVGVFNDGCQVPVGSAPANTGDYPPIDLSGSLQGCWYTYVSASKFTPSGTYLEQGNELFVGCLDGRYCGTFSTTYTFTGKFEPDGTEIHGRCQHMIVDGTGDFAGAKGVINFKDDVVNLKFDLRGQIMLSSSVEGSTLAISQTAAKSGETGQTKVGGC